MDRVNAVLTASVALILVGMGIMFFQKPEPQQVSRTKVFSAFYNKNGSQKNQLQRKSSAETSTTPSSFVSESQRAEGSPNLPSEPQSLTQTHGQKQLLAPEMREALLQKLSDLQHQQQKQNEFLKRKVGLSDDEIKMVHLKTFMLQKELKTAGLLAKKRIPAASKIKKAAIERHIVWMSYTIGAQNFEEYLNL